MKYFKTIVALVFLFSLFLPLYGWIAQVLTGLGPTDLVDSFALKRRGAEAATVNVFHVGDSLIAEAKSHWADTCELRIFENSSVILVRQDVFRDSAIETEIPLSPSLFSAGHSYVATLDVHSYNKPVPGVYLSDSVASAFTVEIARTNLGFQVEHDDLVGSLRLSADLSTVDGYPVADELVKFQLQFDTKRRTEGWFPVGSSKTDASGRAELNLAFGLTDGSYRIRAVHDSAASYGKSENSTEIAISSESALKNSGFDTAVESEGSSVPMSITDVGELSLEVSNSTPYALLATTARANYTVDVPLNGSFVFIVFFLDNTNITGLLGSESFLTSAGPPYECSLLWNASTFLGEHRLAAQVGSGEIYDLQRMILYGEGSIQSSEVLLNIGRCPSNLVLDYPQALCGSTLPVTVAVAKPRLYEAESTEFYVTSTLAPHFFYDGAGYVIDEPVGLAWTRLYSNGTEIYANFTDSLGLVRCLIPLNFASVQLEAVVDDPLLYQQSVQRSVSFRKVRVYDRPAVQGAAFQLNYTVGNLDEAGKVYVGVDNPVGVSSSFFNQSVLNLTVSVLTAKFVSNATTDASGFVSIPTGANYLRVYNTVVLEGDANGDGIVGMFDGAFVSSHWFPGPPAGLLGYHPDADLNRDGRVDTSDSAIVSANWNKKAYRVVFSGRSTVYLDSLGFAKIPFGAAGLTVYKDDVVRGTLVEFFTITLEKSSRTNDLGKAEETWTPNELGRYLVQVKPSAKFDLLTAVTNVTCLDALVNLVGYFDVIKRRVDLTVEQWPAEPTLDTLEITTTARVFDVGLQVPIPDIMVWFSMKDANGNWVLMNHIYSNSSGMAALTWSPMLYNVHFGLHGEFYLWLSIDQTQYTQRADNYPFVDARYRTRLEFLNGTGASMKVPVGKHYSLSVKLTRTDGGSNLTVGYKYIDLYVNGTSVGSARTEPNGVATWSDCFVEQAGVYVYRAVFDSVETWSPREASFAAVAEVAVTDVLFDVVPHDFKTGQQIILNATVLNATSGLSIGQGYPVRFYKVDQNGAKERLGTVDSLTNYQGVALLPYTYPESGAYAFLAETPYGRQVSSSSGLTLTVSAPTSLSLNIEKDESSFDHTISGRLTSDGSGVNGKAIRLLINGTETSQVVTSSEGQFSTILNLQPLNDAPTVYNIQVLFNGDTATTAEAKTTVNGTEYTICTTIRYGYKPASKSAMLTVQPQSTEATTPTKTPEQTQAEAVQMGALVLRPLFRWRYPWYLLNATIKIANLVIQVLFNPILHGGEELIINGTDIFSQVTGEIWQDIILDLLGVFLSYIFAKGLSMWNLGAGILTEVVKGVVQYGLFYRDLLVEVAGSIKMLAIAIANIIMGLVAIATNIGEAFVKTLFNKIFAPAYAVVVSTTKTMMSYAAPLNVVRTPVDYFESLVVDFPIAIVAFLRFAGRI